MLTACHSCATNAEIAQYVAALEKAKAANDPAAIEDAEKWRKRLLSRCKYCKRSTVHDDMRIAHSPHNHDHLTPQRIQYTPNCKIANFAKSDENALRAFIYTATALDPMQFVVALHVARRGTARTVAETVADFAATVRSYKTYKGGVGRATSKAKFLSISKKLKSVAAVRVWAKGHGGRKAKGEDE